MKKVLQIIFAIVAITHWVSGSSYNAYARQIEHFNTINRISPAGTIDRITRGINGSEPDWDSDDAFISTDGRFVAFSSSAANLIQDDTNHNEDVFVYDRFYEKIERVSVASDGSQGIGGPTYAACITPDGRYIAFISSFTNLVTGDTNGFSDVFVHDRQTGVTERVSVASDGSQGNQWTYSNRPILSSDGRYVVFASDSSNLVSGDTNDRTDIFVHDRLSRITERVSVASDGSQANHLSAYPTISADGRFVAYQSFASNLVSGDINGASDIFVYDRQTGTTEMVSFDPGGNLFPEGGWYPSITADGEIIAFTGIGYPNGVVANVFVYDRLNHASEIVSVSSDGILGSDLSYDPSISADGRYVAFTSSSFDLAPGGIYDHIPQIYMHDRVTGITQRISKNAAGVQGNADSQRPIISASGGFIAFISGASNLVGGDTNYFSDVFVYNRTDFNLLLYPIFVPCIYNQVK